MYNPPLHLITFFYSQLTSLYCFSKRVLRMKSTAFFVYGGWVNIFLHSITPNGSFRCSSFHIFTPEESPTQIFHHIHVIDLLCIVGPAGLAGVLNDIINQ